MKDMYMFIMSVFVCVRSYSSTTSSNVRNLRNYEHRVHILGIYYDIDYLIQNGMMDYQEFNFINF